MNDGAAPTSPSELLDKIHDSRLAQDFKTAITAFETFALSNGEILAGSKELADAIVALAFMEWLQDGSDEKSFPEFPRLESIKSFRLETGQTHSPIQR